jgi:phage virion morphogenesis protein
MAGVWMTTIGLDEARAAIGRMIDPGGEFAEILAEHVVGQTKVRIEEEKRSPDGAAWAPWSAAHAATRHGNQSLLLAGGEDYLLESIAAETSDDAVRVGSGPVYGAVHQFGSRDGSTPARPWLGLSAENRAEIEQLAVDLFDELLK